MMLVEWISKQTKRHNQPVQSLPEAIMVAKRLNVQGETGTFERINGRETC